MTAAKLVARTSRQIQTLVLETLIRAVEANMTTAAKYKEYSKLRDMLSGKVKVQRPATTTKRDAPSEVKQSYPKRSRSPEATPSKQQKHSQIEDHAEGIEFATPVVKRTIFGPTPQKDGQVMGIFDLLPGETPSRLCTVLGSANINVARTPSKTLGDYGDDRVEERLRGSRTPLSTGKRFLLDSFVTPRKRKGDDCTTPSSSMREFATPSFLKRDDLFALSTVNGEAQSPEMARPWKRRTFGRSLSNMVKDMREKEKEREDEEWELMREMEGTDYREVVGKGKKPAPPPKAFIEDSHVQLDVDGFVPSDFESDVDAEAAEIKPRKAYKKKGLKRQTRRVNMRPVMTKPQQANKSEPDSESDDEERVVPAQLEEPNEAQDEEVMIQETQFSAQLPDSGYLSGEEDFLPDRDGKTYEEPPEVTASVPAKPAAVEPEIKPGKAATMKRDVKKKGKAKQLEGNPGSKPEKKIDPNSQKHANFQRLKMRGKGPANGKVGGRGRFGKKR